VVPIEQLILTSEDLEVALLPAKGADLYRLIDRSSGTDVLFKSPWGLRSPGPWGGGASSMERWVHAYPGGWQVLVPNGGEECVIDGVTWSYHGEAALLPWQVVEAGPARAVLELDLLSVPLRLRRAVALEGRVLRLEESLSNESDVELEVMWSHHPAFGAPFLEADCVLAAGCRKVLADDRAPGTLLAPASEHDWPVVTTRDGGRLDLSRLPGPDEPRAVLAYLADFAEGWFAITNQRQQLGVALRWPLETFPHAWLWQEVRSGASWPWYRRAYVVAVEPASTIPAQGFAVARSKGGGGVRLAGGESRRVEIEAVLFTGDGAVSGVDAGGVVRFA